MLSERENVRANGRDPIHSPPLGAGVTAIATHVQNPLARHPLSLHKSPHPSAIPSAIHSHTRHRESRLILPHIHTAARYCNTVPQYRTAILYCNTVPYRNTVLFRTAPYQHRIDTVHLTGTRQLWPLALMRVKSRSRLSRYWHVCTQIYVGVRNNQCARARVCSRV